MNLEKLLALIAKRNERKSALVAEAEKCEEVAQLRAMNSELDGLNEDIRSLQELADSLRAEDPDGLDENGQAYRTRVINGEIPGVVRANAKGQEARSISGSPVNLEQQINEIAKSLRNGDEVRITNEVMQHLEQRMATTSNILLESKYKRTVEENFNEIAQTVDLVDSFTQDGGKAYEVAYQITDGDAGYTAEGEDYVNGEPTFGTDSTGYAKITNSAKVNEEVTELSNIDYLSRIISSTRKSIRKKMSHQIVSGAGGTNQLKGIYNAPTKTIPSSYKVELSAIDADALRKIVFRYGGDEDIESPATLFLNRKDLEAFASVKADDGRPYYAITYNGASGTIQEVGGGLRVPYTINSACNAVSVAETAAGAKTMIYGDPQAYEMPLFSPLTVRRSDERYIEKGQVGFFAKIFCGGVVNKYKGFLIVSKKA